MVLIMRRVLRQVDAGDGLAETDQDVEGEDGEHIGGRGP
jgi:hypothetical protein